MKPATTVLVTDLDNTLWDWLGIWHASFSAMLDELEACSPPDVTREMLLSDIRQVHRRHGTPEYVFLIQELPCLQQRHPQEDLTEIYSSAINAFRQARSETIGLYPGVENTLRTLSERGTLLVGYTESLAYQTNYRLRKTKMDRYLEYLYSPPDHDLPKGLTRDQLRKYPSDHYTLEETKHRKIPRGEPKPNPRVLADILEDVGAATDTSAYVGDSLLKDVTMAQSVGVRDIWARYGVPQNRDAYQLLKQVSHWSDEEIAQEASRLEAEEVDPTYILHESFEEILGHLQFAAFEPRRGAKHP